MFTTSFDAFNLAFKGAANPISGIIEPALLIIEVTVFRLKKPVNWMFGFSERSHFCVDRKLVASYSKFG